MLDTLYDAQAMVMLALGLAALAAEVFCLIDASRYSKQSFAAAGKLTKTWWLVILGVATALGFVTIRYPVGIGILGVVAFGVYLADVRPALRAVSPRKRKKGASGSGPYGSW